VSGSPSGDDVLRKSSPAAKAGDIYSNSDETTTELSSRWTQAAFSATHFFPFGPRAPLLCGEHW